MGPVVSSRELTRLPFHNEPCLPGYVTLFSKQTHTGDAMKPLSLAPLADLLLQAGLHRQSAAKPTGSIEGTVILNESTGPERAYCNRRIGHSRKISPLGRTNRSASPENADPTLNSRFRNRSIRASLEFTIS